MDKNNTTCRNCSTSISRGAELCWSCHVEKKSSNPVPYRARPEVKARNCVVSKEWNRKNPESVLLTKAKKRAKDLGLSFNLSKEDIVIPEACPILNIPLVIGNSSLKDNSPTLDRINPNDGYVKGNVAVISCRANRIKNDANSSELEKIYKWLSVESRNSKLRQLQSNVVDGDNSVILLDTYGGDISHGCSAWCSTNAELTDEKRGRIGGLLKNLASNGHHTPFEKSTLHFLVKCDTASHIHIIKHRIGVSVNAESARYKELKEDQFYIPSDWPQDIAERFSLDMHDQYKKYHKVLAELEDSGMSRKRAKESARFYIPYANQLVLDVSFNFRSFMHFQGLRNSEHAQLEIREIAQQMLQLARDTGDFNLSLDAFGYTL